MTSIFLNKKLTSIEKLNTWETESNAICECDME